MLATGVPLQYPQCAQLLTVTFVCIGPIFGDFFLGPESCLENISQHQYIIRNNIKLGCRIKKIFAHTDLRSGQEICDMLIMAI